MSRRDKIIRYVKSTIDDAFDADRHELGSMLDSVSLLQLITFIDEELGIVLDLPSLQIEMFSSIDSVLETLETYAPERPA